MPKLRVHAFSVSADGYGAGPDQSLENPLGGGASTIRQYLQEGLVDEMHVAISPALLGTGEHLFAGLDLPKLGYRRSEPVNTPKATHTVLSKP